MFYPFYLENVKFKVAIWAADSYGDMVTHNLSCKHGDGLALSWVDLTYKKCRVSVTFGWCGNNIIPGIMELPGSFSGRDNSPRPQRGPEPKNLRSLAIFMIEQEMTLRAPDTSTMASWAARASNLLGAVTKGNPVITAHFAATFSAKPFLVLRPVPTAVPPAASMYTLGRVASTLAIAAEKKSQFCCWC